MTHEHDHQQGHQHAHDHHHGHSADRGIRGAVRYMRRFPRMWRSPVSDAVVALLNPQLNDRVVDVGAGMGPATVVAARAGATVIAVDPTPFMRRVLRIRRLWQRSRRRIIVIDGGAESLHIADGSCDGLWAVNSMHHWTNLSAAIAEIHRVLRAGGRIVLVDENFDDPTHPSYAEMRKGRTAHHHEFDDVDVDSVAALLTAAGCTSSSASMSTIAGRPAKIVRGVK